MPNKSTGGIHEILLDSHATTAALQPWQRGGITAPQLLTVFAQYGIDYKGAAISAFSQRGGSISVTVGADFGKLLGPATTAGLTGKLKGEVCTFTLMLLTRFPGELGTLNITHPVSFSTMTGWAGAWTVELAFEIGFKASLSVIETEKESESGTGNMTRKSAQESPYGSADVFEALSTKCEAKAVLEGKITYQGRRIKVRDSAPRSYGSLHDAKLQKDFTDLIGLGTKKGVKDRALAIFDEPRLPEKAKALKPERGFFKTYITKGNVTFATLLSSLAKLRDVVTTDVPVLHRAELLQRIDHHVADIHTFRAHDQAELAEQLKADNLGEMLREAEVLEQDPTFIKALAHVQSRICVLDLWGHEASASLTPKVEATVQCLGSGVTVGAAIKGEIGYKYTTFRYQNFVRNRAVAVDSTPMKALKSIVHSAGQRGLETLVMTQDTQIGYFRVGATPEVTAQVEIGLLGIKGDLQDTKKGSKVKEKLEHVGKKLSYNSMSYSTATAFWLIPYRVGSLGPSVKTTLIPAETGSGYAFGHSYDPLKLAHRFNQHLSGVDEGTSYLKGVAEDIQVKVDQLAAFLTECLSMLISLAQEKVAAVLLEASFVMDSGTGFDLPVERSTDEFETSRSVGWYEPTSGIGGFRSKMLDAGKANKHKSLQAIRLRVRRGDTVDNTSTRFKLGFKFVVELGIEIESVERAGHECVVDMYTQWFGTNHPFLSKAIKAKDYRSAWQALGRGAMDANRRLKDPSRATTPREDVLKYMSYNGAVPPTTLLHQ